MKLRHMAARRHHKRLDEAPQKVTPVQLVVEGQAQRPHWNLLLLRITVRCGQISHLHPTATAAPMKLMNLRAILLFTKEGPRSKSESPALKAYLNCLKGLIWLHVLPICIRPQENLRLLLRSEAKCGGPFQCNIA